MHSLSLIAHEEIIDSDIAIAATARLVYRPNERTGQPSPLALSITSHPFASLFTPLCSTLGSVWFRPLPFLAPSQTVVYRQGNIRHQPNLYKFSTIPDHK